MLKDRICKYCGIKFENIDGKIFANHVRWCDKNPKDRTEEFKLRNKKLKQKIIEKEGELKLFKVICYKCGKEFKVQEREKLFPQKEKYFCSRKCANSHIRTNESKEKTSKTILSKYKNKTKICKRCHKEYSYKSRSKFCSIECRKKWKYEHYYKKVIETIGEEKFLIRKYRNDCAFKFNLADYPDKFNFELIKKYGWYKAKNHGNNLNGISRDHMYSVMDGFINNIDPKIISHPANCQLLRHNENSSKGKKSCITLDELLKRIKEWNEN